MDGWYIATLLINRETIRRGITSSETIFGDDYSTENRFYLLKDTSIQVPPDRFEFLFSESTDFEENLYNDLLIVESRIKEMIKRKRFTDREINILDRLWSGDFFKDRKRNFPPNILSVCSKIAYFLGGPFTDDGFIEHLAEEYSLSEKQLNKVKSVISTNKILVI